MISEERTKWDRRPVLAGSLRAFVTAAPLTVAIVLVTVAGRFLPRPSDTVLVVGRLAGLSVLATGVVWLLDRVFRKLLPLAALFKLSLVFPDQAPSRFKTAIRNGTVRQLQRRMESGEFSKAAPQEAAEQLVGLATMLNAHDRLTRGHTERVRAYAVMIGEELGLEGEDLELLNWSGLVHDIGKLAVPPEILTKPGKPTDEEWAVLRDHPAEADALVEPLRPWLGAWAESATQHHERFDGTGYPKGLAGGAISLAGRIVAVADAYDVMTSTRSYKKPMPAATARRELAANAGRQFDPEVVRAFMSISIGRLRLMMGPLASLLQFPAGGATLGSAAATAVGAAATMAVAVLTGHAGLSADTAAPPEVLAMVTPAPSAENTQDVANDVVAFDAPDVTGEGVEDGIISLDLVGVMHRRLRSAAVLHQPSNGTAAISRSGIVTFVPAANFNGSATVEYEVCFDDGSCHDGIVTFDVRPLNDAPVAVGDAVTIAEDSSALVDVLANDSDIDGDRLTLASVQVLDDHGLRVPPLGASIKGNMITIEPAPNSWGTARLEYSVVDPSGEVAHSTVLVEVTPVNDPPVARDDVLTQPKNTTATFDVMANDADIDDDPLTIIAVQSATHGVASTDGRTVTFVPSTRYVGTAGFTYTIADAAGATSTAAAAITMADVTDRPRLEPDAVNTNEDQPFVVDVLANDGPLDAPIDLATLTIHNSPSRGTATRMGNGFLYTPNPDWSGADVFDYFACDRVEFCATATVTITVTAVNDQPRFVAGGNVTVNEDTGGQLFTGWASAISSGPGDESAQSVAFTVTAGLPSLFATQPAISPSGDLSFTPTPNANGTTTLSVIAIDSGDTLNGGVNQSTTATVTITVTAVNDQPVAGDDAGGVIENQVLVVAAPGLLANDADADGDTLTVATTPVVAPTHGSLTLGTNGSYTYTPSPGFIGTDTFTYQVSSAGGLSDEATVTVTVRSAVIIQTFFFGNNGSSSWNYDLVGSPPPASTPVFDADGDTHPGLTILNGNGADTELNTTKFHLWTTTATSPLQLNGPVTLDLWSTVKAFTLGKNGHPYVYLYDCLGASCSTIAAADAHIGDWNSGTPGFVLRQIDLGSVTHTIATGHSLVARLQFQHEDMWVAMTEEYPSALKVTLVNTRAASTAFELHKWNGMEWNSTHRPTWRGYRCTTGFSFYKPANHPGPSGHGPLTTSPSSQRAERTDHRPISAVDEEIAVGWHAVQFALWVYGQPLVDDPARAAGVRMIGAVETGFLKADQHVGRVAGWLVAGCGRCEPSWCSCGRCSRVRDQAPAQDR